MSLAAEEQPHQVYSSSICREDLLSIRRRESCGKTLASFSALKTHIIKLYPDKDVLEEQGDTSDSLNFTDEQMYEPNDKGWQQSIIIHHHE